jgi:response regulator RpfG family c-di-GMP phosphodiesterase/DNA-binding CsgD family transcriptional regulator
MMNHFNYADIQFPIDMSSKYLKVDIQLVTSEGRPLLPSTTSIRKFYHLLTEEQHQDITERFIRITRHIQSDSTTYFFEAYPGLKVAITPLLLQEPLFLISGFFLGISDFSMLKKSLEQELGRNLDGFQFEQFPGLDEKNRERVITELNRLQQYLLMFMNNVSISERSKKYAETLNKLGLIFSEPMSFDLKFSKSATPLLAMGPFSIMGLAVPTGNNSYTIKYVYGKEANKWMGYEFDAGEGFFGWVSVIQNSGKWDDVTQDPRYYSIRQVCDSLRSLSLFPLIQNKENAGILFFGAEATECFTEEWMSFIQGIAPIFKQELLIENYQSKVEYMSKKIIILMGISQLLTTNIEPKRILNIVVDFLMSIEGVDHSFGVILSDNKDQVKWLVGRGMSIDEIKIYCNDFVERQVNELITDQQMVFPIQMNGKTMGWFFIGSKDKINRKDVRFTNTMVSVANTVLKSFLLFENQAGYSQVDTILTLIQSKDIKIYEHSRRVKDWVDMICSQLNVDEKTSLLATNSALLHEIGILVMNEHHTSLAKLHTGKMDDHFSLGASVLETIPALHHLAPIIRAHHEFFDGNGPLGLKNEEVSLTSKILHVADEFDALFLQSDLEPDRVLKIISEMEQQIGKQYDPEVIEAFSHVLRRRFSVEVSNINLSEKKSDADSTFNTLSPRELEVISLMAKGLSNKEIASHLYISEHTVKNHISNIFQKLNLSDRTSVVSLAYQKGLI